MRRIPLTALCFLSFLSLAGVSRANDPQSDDNVILEVKTSGGHVPPSRWGWKGGVKIYESGRVIGFSKENWTAPTKTRNLAALTTPAMIALKKQLDTLQEGPIVFPDTPTCSDAPHTDYTAKGETEVLFARTANCRTGYLEGSESASRLYSILAGLRTLDSLP